MSWNVWRAYSRTSYTQECSWQPWYNTSLEWHSTSFLETIFFLSKIKKCIFQLQDCVTLEQSKNFKNCNIICTKSHAFVHISDPKWVFIAIMWEIQIMSEQSMNSMKLKLSHKIKGIVIIEKRYKYVVLRTYGWNSPQTSRLACYSHWNMGNWIPRVESEHDRVSLLHLSWTVRPSPGRTC